MSYNSFSVVPIELSFSLITWSIASVPLEIYRKGSVSLLYVSSCTSGITEWWYLCSSSNCSKHYILFTIDKALFCAFHLHKIVWSSQPYEVDTIIIPILQMKKVRHQEDTYLRGQRHNLLGSGRARKQIQFPGCVLPIPRSYCVSVCYCSWQ